MGEGKFPSKSKINGIDASIFSLNNADEEKVLYLPLLISVKNQKNISKKAFANEYDKGDLALMLKRYLIVVHNISLDIEDKNWRDHLRYYERRLDDGILSDVWQKIFGKSEISRKLERRIKSLNFKRSQQSFYLRKYAPKKQDLLHRYKSNKVTLSWF